MPRKPDVPTHPCAAEIGALYRLPLDEFTPARNRLAAKLEAAGNGDAADDVRRLAKPVRSAWIVNRLHQEHPAVFERLLQAGEQLRLVQGTGNLEALRRAGESRREALDTLLDQADAVAGSALAPTMRRRVQTTLEAVAAYGDAGPGQVLGCMAADIDPPGFDALLFVAANAAAGKRKKAGGRKAPAAPRVDPRTIARARVLVEKARKEFARKQSAATHAAAARQGHVERLEETRELERAAQRGLRLARDRAERCARKLEQAEAAARRADAACEQARRKLDQAQAALDRTAPAPRKRG